MGQGESIEAVDATLHKSAPLCGVCGHEYRFCVHLEAYFAGLHAPAIPSGLFDGKAWSHDLPFVQTVAHLFWQGKVFEGAKVLNRMHTRLLIPGVVSLVDDAVIIDYPQLGLRDTLKSIDESHWLGRMQLGQSVVWFTLTAA